MDHIEIYRNIIKQDVVLGKGIKSPFRNDRKPSFGIYKSKNGSIRWKDFAYSGGDIYSLVMTIEGCNFSEAVEKIYKTMGNGIEMNFKEEYLKIDPIYEYFVEIETKNEIIDFSLSKFIKKINYFNLSTNIYDRGFRQFLTYGSGREKYEEINGRFHVNFEAGLKPFLDKIYINLDVIDLYFGILISKGVLYKQEEGKQRIKILDLDKCIFFPKGEKCYKLWFPFKEKHDRYKAGPADGSFFGQLLLENINSFTQEHLLIKDIIIMAGEKDVLTFMKDSQYSFWQKYYDQRMNKDGSHLFQTMSVCLSSESANLTWDQYNKLKCSCSGNIFVYYDNDEVGKKNMNKICEEYPDIIPLGVLHDMYPNLKDYNDIVSFHNGSIPFDWEEIKKQAIKKHEQLVSSQGR